MKKPTVADGSLLTELHGVVFERLGDDVSHLTLSRAVRGLFFTGVALDTRELSARGQPFHVLELDPSVLESNELPYDVPADQAPRVVPGADVLIATGTTLINGTLDPLLGLLREGAAAAVIGPTAPLLTAPYARRGATRR